MIIIRYCGGLGNQIYQYSMQLLMRKLYPNQDIKADITHYNLLEEHNGFEIERVFDVKIDKATISEIKENYCGLVYHERTRKLPYKLRYWIAHHAAEVFRMINSRFHPTIAMKRVNGYAHNAYNDLIFHLDSDKDIYLDGLWQNINYLEVVREELLESLRFKRVLNEKDQMIKDKIEKEYSVSIHIRRGDFCNSKFDICSELYYKTAIKYVLKLNKNAHFFVFSDDISYAKNTYNYLENVQFIEHSSDCGDIDMKLMSHCKVNIIANSTFSFWASYLNRESELTIAPKYSVRGENGYHIFSVPNSWVKINPFTGEVEH